MKRTYQVSIIWWGDNAGRPVSHPAFSRVVEHPSLQGTFKYKLEYPPANPNISNARNIQIQWAKDKRDHLRSFGIQPEYTLITVQNLKTGAKTTIDN